MGDADRGKEKKFPCPDCTFCQWCSDDRCRMCRGEKKCGRKLSIAEQIELYERMNRRGRPEEDDEGAES